MKVHPYRALLMRQFDVIWCPLHLMPYQKQWPLGGPTASVYLVDAAAEKIGAADGYGLLRLLVEASPLCCYLDAGTLNGIYERTVPK